MPVSPARAAAFEILFRVEREQSYASELLHSTRFAKLSHTDHALATELVMGVLRWRSWLDCQIEEASSQKLGRLDDEVLTALRAGVYQLRFLSRVPARAAVFESVELVKKARKSSAAPFVNAVLRKIAQTANGEDSSGWAATALAEIEASSDAITLAQNSAHPQWLVARWIEHYGLAKAKQICGYDQHPPPVAIRIDHGESLDELALEGVKLGPGRLLSSARFVLAGDVTQTQAYLQGRLAIQDESSQLVALLVGQGKNILDCCAAPGGKTLLLAKRNPQALVIAADLHPHRVRRMRDLLHANNVSTIAGDARQLPFSGAFDRILADVPCSGTGTLGRNPEIKWRLNPDDLEDLRARQTAILKSALAQLASGGRLVYSTCSMEREENEAVVEPVLNESADYSIIDCRDELEKLRDDGELCVHNVETLCDGPYLRTIPGVQAGDGFFAAIVARQHA